MGDAPPLAARRLRVFLCHASGDKPAVRELYQRLRQDGFQAWLDEEDLLPGQEWQVEIPKAVRAADLVLVCLSPRSVNKEGYIQKEIKVALDAADEKPEGTIFLVPLKLEECPVPERLSRWQWVDFGAAKGYEKLVRALHLRAKALGPDTAGTKGAYSGSHAPSYPAGTVKVNPKDGLEYVRIPPGEFLMGATPGDDGARENEKPRHPVRITTGFWLGKTPVTVAAYKRFVGDTLRVMPEPPDFNTKWKKEDHPIVMVNWNDAKEYCEWAGGSLPTEAEWEYAARGGKEGLKYPWGNEISPDRANYSERWGTAPVLKFPPQNEWGLHDMAGNVWEWVADWYDEKYAILTLDKPVEDPEGPVRVLRGGSWGDGPRVLGTAVRGRCVPGGWSSAIGFRVVLEEEDFIATIATQLPQGRTWVPRYGEKFCTYGDEPDDPVQWLTWGAKADHDAKLLRERRVFRTQVEAEIAKTERFSSRPKE